MKKIKKIKDNVSYSIKIATAFGIKFGINDFICSSILRKKNYFGKKAEFIRYEKIKEWLYINYFEQIKNEYENNMLENDTIQEECPIWIFWWQGIEDAPPVVKICIKSIDTYKGNHNINIITSDNIKDYVDIPNYIYEKLENGIITLTQFSDILRAQLLYQYGGIWMDSTILMVGEFPKDMYKKTFYTIHHQQRSEYHVCKGKWTGFFMASVPGNPIFKFLTAGFYEYWKTQECLIAYLLIDCFIAIGYENISDITKQIDEVPINNVGTLKMATCLNTIYKRKLFEGLCKDTSLHKLSNKLYIKEDNKTIYHYIYSRFK